MSVNDEKTGEDLHHVESPGDKLAAVGKVKEVNTASVALAAAVEEQKPKMWSANMIRLYMIMGVGYLVSTMNGFGKSALPTL